jgi:hypothetical protein
MERENRTWQERKKVVRRKRAAQRKSKYALSNTPEGGRKVPLYFFDRMLGLLLILILPLAFALPVPCDLYPAFCG